MELPIQNMRLIATSETFVAQTGSMCYNIDPPGPVGAVSNRTGPRTNQKYVLRYRSN